MNIVIVDNERLVLEGTVATFKKVLPQDTITGFQSGKEALSFVHNTIVDIAVLDIEMPEVNGIELALKLKQLNQNINIIFVTGYKEYALEAFSIHASGYLLKPVSENSIRKEIENLRYPTNTNDYTSYNLYFRCFGHFEVFHSGTPVKFKYSKTKELLAYLVNIKGATIPNGEAIAILWEDRPVTMALKSQFRNCVSDLRNTLNDIGEAELIDKVKNNLGIVFKNIHCDYKDFCDGIPYAINSFHNEYMTQYSWAEFTRLQ